MFLHKILFIQVSAKESAYSLTTPIQCKYSLNNPWNNDIGPIVGYVSEFGIGEYAYRAIASTKLVSPELIGLCSHWSLLSETAPFCHIGRRSLWNLRATSLLPSCRHVEGPVCCLLDLKKWDASYFHWLFDTLPRVLAVLDYQIRTGSTVSLLVPLEMFQWQIDSLHYLGLKSKNFISINRSEVSTSISADVLIAAPSARVQGLADAPDDCMTPGIIRELGDKLIKNSRTLQVESKCPRIYVSREDASSRRVVNENALRSKLSTHGFQVICLAGMPFAQQIQLFYSASNIIGVHGAGLSNLLFSRGASVLEVFSEGHCIRPEFFQLASINSVAYFHYVCPSINESNDIYMDLSVLDSYIALTC